MSPVQSGYDRHGNHWSKPVCFGNDVYVDEREELEARDSPASDPFHPDPLQYRFLTKDSNVYLLHHGVLMFKFLTPIRLDFKAAHEGNARCRDFVFATVIADMAGCLVTVQPVPFAMQSTLPDGQYVQQNVGPLEADSGTEVFQIVKRYGPSPGPDEARPIILPRRVCIAYTRWWTVDWRTGPNFYNDTDGFDSRQKYRWTAGWCNAQSFKKHLSN